MSSLKDAVKQLENKEDKLNEVEKKQSQPSDHKNLSQQELEHYKKQRELENESLRQNIEERKKYAKLIFRLICVWLGIILTIIVLQGIGAIPGTFHKFELSDSVLITLITTTTANIAAYFLVVTQFLFPSNNKGLLNKKREK